MAEESWRSLKDRVDEIRALDAVEKLKSPLDGNDLMEHFERSPGRWIKHVKDYLESQVVEGSLNKDDTQGARELAEAYVREHNLFGEE